MNTSFKTRLVAFVASVFVTFGTVYLVAGYAYPEAGPVVLLASAH